MLFLNHHVFFRQWWFQMTVEFPSLLKAVYRRQWWFMGNLPTVTLISQWLARVLGQTSWKCQRCLHLPALDLCQRGSHQFQGAIKCWQWQRSKVGLYIHIYIHTGWWFQTFFIFHFIHGMTSFPLTNSIIFQDGFLTTNQIYIGRWVISLRNSKGWWDDSHVIYLTAHSHDFNGEFKVICLVDFVCTSSDLKMYVPCFVQPQSLSFSALNALKCPLSHEALVSIPSPNNIWTAEVGRQRGMPSQYWRQTICSTMSCCMCGAQFKSWW